MDVLGNSANITTKFDGQSLLKIINGKENTRSAPIGFQSANQVTLIDNRYKIYSNNKGRTFALYDIIKDPAETNDLSAEKPDIIKQMTDILISWQKSCADSIEENGKYEKL